MYAEYWQLESLPFEEAAPPRFFFGSGTHKQASVRVVSAITTRKGIALVTGDYGMGKSMLCRVVMDMLAPNAFKTAYLPNPRLDGLDLTREIAYQLGGDIDKDFSKCDVLRAFQSLLERHRAAGRHCSAIIDEAQLLTDVPVLEDLRLLLNYQIEGQLLLTLVLVGQDQLNEILRPMPQITQRIGQRVSITPLEKGEVREYVGFRLRVAGGSLDLFEESAIAEIEELSRGRPREINALCDMSLLRASLLRRERVTLADVVEAGTERMSGAPPRQIPGRRSPQS